MRKIDILAVLVICLICIAGVRTESEAQGDGQMVKEVPSVDLKAGGCDYKCSYCSGSTCMSCYTGYYLSSGYCYSCGSGCYSCSSYSYCSSCNSGYYMSGGYCYANSNTSFASALFSLIFFVILIVICVCICKSCNKRNHQGPVYVATGDNMQPQNIQTINNNYGHQHHPVFPPPPAQPVFNNPGYNNQYNPGMGYNSGMPQNYGQQPANNNNTNYPAPNFT